MSQLSWSQARAAAHAAATPLPPDTVPLAEALGGTLATSMRAAVPVPGFDLAAMDGYAVSGSGPWQVSRVVLAGHGDPGDLGAGEAVEVATGAPVPRGTGAVLPYEDACRSDDQVRGAVQDGRHVRRTGDDVPIGAELLAAGSMVGPAALGLAASVGLDVLALRQRPRVVALLTGDEIVHSGRPGSGRVRDAIGPQLPGLLGWFGAELTLRLPVPDQPAGELAAALAAAQGEVVLSCGATASGPADHLHTALAELGGRLVVDGVACRPGHPQSLAVLPDGRYVVGVPGNPYAALVAMYTLVQPLIGGLSGRPLRHLPRARLAGDLPQSAVDTRLVPTRWAGDTLVPTGRDRPGSLWGAAQADVLAVVPPDWAGHPVEFIRLAGPGG
ncbi:MAG: molybdopterin molybdotransferase MoeA [Actinobacteria bacterium]|nr:molybdopterin molybdotransferase MoeA [Actinomycetota bacterium]MBI3687879.1 molybdopterin molybdotransferase MoeA [Actinomycetota bacterium]